MKVEDLIPVAAKPPRPPMDAEVDDDPDFEDDTEVVTQEDLEALLYALNTCYDFLEELSDAPRNRFLNKTMQKEVERVKSLAADVLINYDVPETPETGELQ